MGQELVGLVNGDQERVHLYITFTPWQSVLTLF
jgi:hypothetical protein